MEQLQDITYDTTRNMEEKWDGGALSLESIAVGGPALVAIVQVPDLKLRFVNKQFENYLGYGSADLKHEQVYLTDLLGQYQLDRFFYQLRIAKEGIAGQSRFVIYHLRNSKGEVHAYSVFASPMDSEQHADENLYYLVMHPNASKWDSPYTSFVTSELFLEHFNSEDFGTFECIIDLGRFFLSEGIYRICEIENNGQDITAEYMRSFIHPADKPKIEEMARKALLTGEDLSLEFNIITAKQNLKILHCITRIVKNKEGYPLKFAGSIRDITQQRSIEDDLKKKVTELYHSNKELEEFAYVASHDMQEPLRKITVFSDRLSEKYKDVLTGDGAMYLSRMIASAENMRLLIEGLLEFSRISKTKHPFESVDLNSILKQVKTELELVIEDTGTVIDSDILPSIDAIASQMKQLFTNIIGNAIKFRKPDTAPVITIESQQIAPSEITGLEVARNTDYYKVSITDNGVGFEEEYAVRIFQVFQRLHGKSEYPGSGIGLAICKKILEYHKGLIYAENIPDKGARFTFILPQKQTIKEI